MLVLVVGLASYSMTGFAESSILYGYDRVNHEIYAKNKNNKRSFKFKEDYTGNPSYWFDFFSGIPAIVADSHSLHDSTVYATLDYANNEFKIDCLYYNIKSKRNGLLVKEGVCGLNLPAPEKHAEYIDKKVNSVEDDMDIVDTSLLLDNKVSYITLIVFRDRDKTIYKNYDSKQAMLDDSYSIFIEDNKGNSEIILGSPWVIYGNNKMQLIEVMSEKVVDGKIELSKAVPKASSASKCLTYPAVSVKKSKSYLYDSSYNIKKSYLIENDKVNLLFMSEDRKWCQVRYFNNQNKYIDNNMLCSDLRI